MGRHAQTGSFDEGVVVGIAMDSASGMAPDAGSSRVVRPHRRGPARPALRPCAGRRGILSRKARISWRAPWLEVARRPGTGAGGRRSMRTRSRRVPRADRAPRGTVARVDEFLSRSRRGLVLLSEARPTPAAVIGHGERVLRSLAGEHLGPPAREFLVSEPIAARRRRPGAGTPRRTAARSRHTRGNAGIVGPHLAHPRPYGLHVDGRDAPSCDP